MGKLPSMARDLTRLPSHDKGGNLLLVEIEQFLLNTTFHSGKEARVLGWKGPRAALKKVRDFER